MKALLIARIEQEQRRLTERQGYDWVVAQTRCLALAIFAQETAEEETAIIDVPWWPANGDDAPKLGPPFD